MSAFRIQITCDLDSKSTHYFVVWILKALIIFRL